jgi:hypothetical protein
MLLPTSADMTVARQSAGSKPSPPPLGKRLGGVFRFLNRRRIAALVPGFGSGASHGLRAPHIRKGAPSAPTITTVATHRPWPTRPPTVTSVQTNAYASSRSPFDDSAVGGAYAKLSPGFQLSIRLRRPRTLRRCDETAARAHRKHGRLSGRTASRPAKGSRPSPAPS